MNAQTEIPIEDRRKYLLLVVDRMLTAHSEWVDSDSKSVQPIDELWESIEETIDVFSEGTIPSNCRALQRAVDDMYEPWRVYAESVMASRNPHAIPSQTFWKALEIVQDARQQANPRRRRTLEPIAQLINEKVPPAQICDIYGFMHDDGTANTAMLQEEIDKPGTHVNKDFVPPLERQDLERERRHRRIAEQARRKMERKIEDAEQVAGEPIEELISQGISASQIGDMKKMSPQEVQQYAEEHGLPIPPLHYTDPHAIRGDHEPDISEAAERALDLARRSGKPEEPESDPPEWQGARQDFDETIDEADEGLAGAMSVEQEVISYHKDGLKPGQIVETMGKETVSVQKVNSIVKRYAEDPSAFEVVAP